MTSERERATTRAPGATYTRRGLLRRGLGAGAGALALSAVGGSLLAREAAASTAPLAPRNLTLNRSGGCPYLLWELTGADARGSRVEKSADGVNFAHYHTYPLPSNPSPYSVYIDHGAGEYGTFYYHVRAYNAWGDSPPSNVVSIYVPPPPAAPSNLTATTISRTQIDLAWQDNADNEGGFWIEESLDRATWTQLAAPELGPNRTTYSRTGLANSKTYYYRVRATNTSGESAYSNIASARTGRP